ncbi:hypothetical protein BK816_04835 [Boudabousia tangfeifanii]|uniref:DUF4253 domain-containing protein n=1 Tax=Boudabousia tangfeifanii TaxID=1912795 RepID=A0A1D9MKI5_9ACTO|nr:hypothetical protein [Boudabousia tangfeifanii]AOZ72699.1 hypothetical protein BK816_04835 [Boudabousia tangfeifanii]
MKELPFNQSKPVEQISKPYQGWTVDTGVFELVRPFLALTQWEAKNLKLENGVPSQPPSFAHFDEIGITEVRKLQGILPQFARSEAQNYAPNTAELLKMVENHPEATLYGYYVGPQRGDERITFEGFTVYGFKNWKVPMEYSRSRYRELWQEVCETLELENSDYPPDEIRLSGRINHKGEPEWVFWWD